MVKWVCGLNDGDAWRSALEQTFSSHRRNAVGFCKTSSHCTQLAHTDFSWLSSRCQTPSCWQYLRLRVFTWHTVSWLTLHIAVLLVTMNCLILLIADASAYIVNHQGKHDFKLWWLGFLIILLFPLYIIFIITHCYPLVVCCLYKAACFIYIARGYWSILSHPSYALSSTLMVTYSYSGQKVSPVLSYLRMSSLSRTLCMRIASFLLSGPLQIGPPPCQGIATADHVVGGFVFQTSFLERWHHVFSFYMCRSLPYWYLNKLYYIFLDPTFLRLDWCTVV